jgi:heme o synthase
MSKMEMPSVQKVEKLVKKRETSTLISDLKALLKAPVLFANALPVFTGFWLALHYSNASFIDNLSLFLFTIIGSTLIMAGALILNNWYDVDIDTIMDRTKHRPTVTGSIPMNVVLAMGIGFTVLGFILMMFTTIEATIYSFVGWFTYVILYTMWSKRRYTLNTVIGSVSGAVTPLIGWTTLESSFHIVPIILFLILFVFQMPHTFSIAMKKYEEYKAAKVAMLPVVHGFEMTKRQMIVYITCLLPLPFYLATLGTTFLVISTILNIGWLAVSIKSYFSNDNFKWAHINFLYSVNYITILFVVMILVTL